jgi:hypothetical protein
MSTNESILIKYYKSPLAEGQNQVRKYRLFGYLYYFYLSYKIPLASYQLLNRGAAYAAINLNPVKEDYT